MSKVTSEPGLSRQARFSMYDPVVLRKNVKEFGLKKGDKGAIMEVWSSGPSIGYLVDFPEKNIAEDIREVLLKRATLIGPKHYIISVQPPAMPAEVAKASRDDARA